MAKARPYKYMNRERGHAILVRATWPTTTEQHARRRLSRPTCATMDFSGLLGHPQLSYQYGHLAPAAWQSDIVMYSACIFRLCTYFCFFRWLSSLFCLVCACTMTAHAPNRDRPHLATSGQSLRTHVRREQHGARFHSASEERPFEDSNRETGEVILVRAT